MSVLLNMFKKPRKAEVGVPTLVTKNFSAHINKESGIIEGLPPEFVKLLKEQVTESERNRNPEAALSAVLYYSDLSAESGNAKLIHHDHKENTPTKFRENKKFMNDEAIYKEFEEICNKSVDPLKRFIDRKEVGAGASGKYFSL
jgi:hypothetical protein